LGAAGRSPNSFTAVAISSQRAIVLALRLSCYSGAWVVPRSTHEFDGIRMETVDWPLVLMEFPEQRVPDAALHALLDHLEAVEREAVKAREKGFFITDLTRMREIAPASQRKFVGEWLARTSLLQKAAGVGGANVTPSPLLRGVITAIFWIKPSPTPTIFVATRNEAIFRGIDMLEAAGEPISLRLKEMREATRKMAESA
jgi:hypothetical protein